MSRDVATMDELAVEGCTLKLRVEGQEAGPVLVLSHMLGTDLTLWDNLVPELGKHFRLVRYDTRGHGGSERGDAPVTLNRLGRDVIAILDALGIERAHFCGESMGGAVGLWLLVHAPARIERAVIAGSAAKLGTPAVWNTRIAAALTEGMEQAVAPTVERWFGADFAERAPEPVAAIRAMLRVTAPEGYADCCGALRDMDLREAVRAVPHPVLVLRGAEDPSVAAQDARHLVEAMAGATALEVDARHCASIEAEAAFVAAVVKFLTAKAAAPRRAAGARPAKAPQTRTQPSARRVGKSGVGAARRPVARTVPVSGKAVAKASADRKTATRKSAARATPAPSRRAPAKAAPRGATTALAKTAPPKLAAPKLAAPKTASSKSAGPKSAARASKAAKSAAKPAKASAAPRKVAGLAKAAAKVASPVAKASPTRRAAPPARSSVARGKPTTAAALRAAVKTRASSKALPAKAGVGKAGAKIGTGAPKSAKAAAGKGATGKGATGKSATGKSAAGPAPAKRVSLKTSPRNPPRRTGPLPSKPRVPPGRGRRKP